jgi:phosphatidylglycerophosphate synthase
MYSLAEVKSKSRRANYRENAILHFFSAHVSIYFTFIFVNLHMSANLVTGVFFLTGLLGFFALVFCTGKYVALFYIAWRLHIIFDICDGEVARFFQKFTLNGVYWDYMIHSLLYPLYGIGICYFYFNSTGDTVFLILAICFGLTGNFLNAVKNNYSRALHEKGIEKVDTKVRKTVAGFKLYLFNLISAAVGFEGFLLVSFILILLGISNTLFIKQVLVLYLLFHTIIILAKFFSLSKKGQYSARN